MANYVTASDGTQLDLDSLPQVFGYSGTQLITITVQYLGNTYVQTFTYTGQNITAQSNFVKQ